MARKRFVIIGLGNFGSGVAETLVNEGHEVIALDFSERNVDRLGSILDRAVVGDGTSREVIERAGGKGADAAVVSVGDDITASILATLAVRDVGIPNVYVKVISFDHARVMEKQGVTETIFPERESALRLGMRDTTVSADLKTQDTLDALHRTLETMMSRLASLESEGLVVGEPYTTRPVRHAYRLTARGAELAGTLRMLDDRIDLVTRGVGRSEIAVDRLREHQQAQRDRQHRENAVRARLLDLSRGEGAQRIRIPQILRCP